MSSSFLLDAAHCPFIRRVVSGEIQIDKLHRTFATLPMSGVVWFSAGCWTPDARLERAGKTQQRVNSGQQVLSFSAEGGRPFTSPLPDAVDTIQGPSKVLGPTSGPSD